MQNLDSELMENRELQFKSIDVDKETADVMEQEKKIVNEIKEMREIIKTDYANIKYDIFL